MKNYWMEIPIETYAGRLAARAAFQLVAAMQQHPMVVRLLLGKGADPNLKFGEVKTAYDYPRNYDNKAILNAYSKEE